MIVASSFPAIVRLDSAPRAVVTVLDEPADEAALWLFRANALVIAQVRNVTGSSEGWPISAGPPNDQQCADANVELRTIGLHGIDCVMIPGERCGIETGPGWLRGMRRHPWAVLMFPTLNRNGAIAAGGGLRAGGNCRG